MKVPGRVKEVPTVSLSAREQQELDSIEDEIAASAPRLASLLATFTRLTAGEELPVRERIKDASRRRGRRRPPFLMSRHHGRSAMSLSLAAVLLWLAVSIALVVTALVISRGGNGKGCTLQGIACAGQAPANAARPAKPSAAGRARGTPGQPDDSARQRRKDQGLSNAPGQPGWGHPVTLLRASTAPVTRVVVGVDGSAASTAALLWAAAEALRYQAGLRIVSAWGEVSAWEETAPCRAVHPAQAAARLVQKALAHVLSQQHYPPRIGCAALRGTPGQALVSQARDTGLLVLGAASTHAAHLPGSIGRYYLLHGRGPLALVPAWDDLPAAHAACRAAYAGHARVR
jgi:nucleotide-binding universal stress UspA family protein